MSLFKVEQVFFGEVKVIAPTVFKDDRGWYMPSFRRDDFEELGIPGEFVQDNHSYSMNGVVRGLHFQLNPEVGKLMRVTQGRAYLVAVDLRRNSPTFLKWCGTETTAENRLQIWAPGYFARGFCALSNGVELQYKFTELFNPKTESAIRWDDPDIGIDWPVKEPILSERDRNAPSAREYFKGL